MAKRPNFLIFITDQHRADHIGAYGNKSIRTPHIDGIANAGMRFNRFYVASAICQSNRATLMTGRMPTLHNVCHNGVALSTEDTTFVEILRAAGYRTSLMGKSHLQNMTGWARELDREPDSSGTPPPEELSEASHHLRKGDGYENENSHLWLTDANHDVNLPYYGFDEVRLCTMHGDQVQGHYTGWLRERLPDADKVRLPENALSDPRYTAPQARRTAVPEELYPTSFIADETVACLERHAAAGEPFFVQCSFPDPHHPFTPPGRYWDMYDPDEMVVPRSFHESSRDQIPPLAAMHAEFEADPDMNRELFRPFVATEPELRQIIALTYGMITMIDDAVGRVLDRLRSLDLDRDTVVIFTSDHGDWMGEHGIVLKAPMHYHGLIRVPLIWADPGAARAGEATDAMGSTLDLARTILERAGVAPFNGMQGQNLNPVIAGDTDMGAESVLIEQRTQRPYMGLANKVSVRTFVTEQWRMTVWQGMEWGELYDLRNDPAELVNLWAAPEAREIRATLMEKLARKMIDLEDISPWSTAAG